MNVNNLTPEYINKKVKASDYKCVECGKQAEVWYPIVDPDIPAYPYCRKCAKKARQKLLLRILREEKWPSNIP